MAQYRVPRKQTAFAEWANLPLPYLNDTAATLNQHGLWVRTFWNGPTDPRETTFLLASPPAVPISPYRQVAVVWDEETGFRVGDFCEGGRGMRTRLLRQRYICAEVLPDLDEVAETLRYMFRLRGDLPWWRVLWPGWRRMDIGSPVPIRYRRHRDHDDGFDEALATW